MSGIIRPVVLEHPWLAIALCAATYISDYYLTLYAARLYQSHGKEHFGFSGSMELTPYYQQDIDQLRGLSWKFLRALILLALLSAGFWWLTTWLGYPSLFVVLIGALLLREAPIHIRHLRNIILYRSLRDGQSVTGRVEYSRAMVYQLSAVELSGFFLLFLLLSWPADFFFIGGALGCGVIALKHWQAVRASQKVS